MYALTVYQPWASLIMLGAKPFEFRKWDYRSRVPKIEGLRIVIHAAARPIKPAEILDIRKRLKDRHSGLDPTIASPLIERLLDAHKCAGVLELSAGLGTAIIGRPRKVTDIFSGTVDSDRLDHTVYGWPLSELQPFDHPIPCRGAQGFWGWKT